MATINKKNYQELLEQWNNSGQSQIAFCKTHQLTYSRFIYWKKKYKQLQQPLNDDFIPVSVTGAPSCELVMPDGKRITFYQEVSASFLKTLLQ